MRIRLLALLVLVALWQPAPRAQTTSLVGRTLFTLTAVTPSFTTGKVPLDAETANITLRLRRPTTGNPLAWDDSATVRVSIRVFVDGRPFTTTAHFIGGPRTVDGTEVADASVSLQPQIEARPDLKPIRRIKGKTYLELTRLGETATTEYAVDIAVALLAGASATLDLLGLEQTTTAAPMMEYDHSVAFNSATSTEASSGTGVLSTTIDPADTSDLAAFASLGQSDDGGDPITSTSITYGGTGMAEQWDLTVGSDHNASGYTLAGNNVPTSLQTVTGTASGGTSYQALGIIVVDGVDQTTPVGTAATTTAANTVTVGSVSADDVVVDSVYTVVDPGTATAGANQTEQYRQTDPNRIFVGSSQDGADGGVMSWTLTDVIVRGLGAIAFKPATAAAAPKRLLTLGAGE